MEEPKINWEDDMVKEIQQLWRKSGYTLKALQKKYFLSKPFLARIVKNVKKKNDINKHGFKIVPEFKQRDDNSRTNYRPRRHNNRRPNNNYRNNNYQNNRKSAQA